MSSNIIEIQNISKYYHKFKALDRVSLTVKEGTILGIIGKSGAGKTTLLRCLNSLERPDEGDIKIYGSSLIHSTLQERKRILQKIGTIFQHYNLLSRRTVFDNITLPLEITGQSIDKRYIEEILEWVGLSEKQQAYPSQLSGGQCQRIAIARALSTQAKLLLCDEFTSALDSQTSLEILELLQDLNQNHGVTVVLITHDMQVVREICEEVCVIDEGKIIEKETIENIVLQPQHALTKQFLALELIKDLPHPLQHKLKPQGHENDDVVMRLIFSGEAAQKPIIASLIQQFNIQINIIAGHLDHIRETAFGCLIITFPYGNEHQILTYLKHQRIKGEIVGYIDLCL